MRILLKILTVILLFVAVAWLYFDRSFEPLLAVIGTLISVITAFFLPEKKLSAESKNGKGDTRENGATVVYKDKSTHKGDNNF